MTSEGALHTLPGQHRVGGGPCAIVQRRDRDGSPLVHGTCILQRFATEPTPIDATAPHQLVLPDGTALHVRIIKHTMTACGPEIVRFEGPGTL